MSASLCCQFAFKHSGLLKRREHQLLVADLNTSTPWNRSGADSEERNNSAVSPSSVVKPITFFPKGRRSRGSMFVKIFVEPITQHASRGLQPTNLNTFRPPALFAVEDRERRPANLALWRLSYGACTSVSESASTRTLICIKQEGHKPRLPRILEFAFGSQLACKLLESPVKCTIGSLWPLNPRKSGSGFSSQSSSSYSGGGSILVTRSLMRISLIATDNQQVLRTKIVRTRSRRVILPSSVSIGRRCSLPSPISSWEPNSLWKLK